MKKLWEFLLCVFWIRRCQMCRAYDALAEKRQTEDRKV